MCITLSEFQKEYGHYFTLAKRQPITITNHGRAELVVLNAEEYERLRRLDDRVAMRVEDLSEAELDALDRVQIPKESEIIE